MQERPTAQDLSASRSTGFQPVRPPRLRDKNGAADAQPDQSLLGLASNLQQGHASTRSRRQAHVSSADEPPRLPRHDQPPSYDSSVEMMRSGQPRISVNRSNLTLPRRSHSARRNTPLDDIVFGTTDNQ